MSVTRKQMLASAAITVGLTAGAFGVASATTSQVNPLPPTTTPATATPPTTAADTPDTTGATDTTEPTKPEDPNDANLPGSGHADPPGQQDHQFEGVE